MSARISFARSGQAIGDAASVLRNNAAAAGMDASVPGCPGWTVHDLVRHVGMVHRWAAAVITGGPPGPREEDLTAGLAGFADPLDWLDEGLIDLLNVLTRPGGQDGGGPGSASFLTGAPSARREAWARRMAHESTIHAADAMAARLGTAPRGEQMWFPGEFACDGIDELLTGFATREDSRLRAERERTMVVAVAPAGIPGQSARSADAAWTVRWGPDGAVTTPGASGTADATVTGSAAGLYLALWNRGEEFDVTGEVAVVAQFRELMRITW